MNRLIVFFAVATACLFPLQGGSIGVSPVRVELSQKQSTAMITIENHGTAEEMYQLETTAWSQADGNDRYVRTQELIAAPPIFKIAPGRSQVVRLGVRHTEHAGEAAYRIFIQQIPVTAADAEIPAGVQTLLRIGVPVFFQTRQSQQSKPRLNWVSHTSPEGKPFLEVENPSQVHVQIGKVKMADGTPIPVSLYVLPGQRRRWHAPAEAMPQGPFSIEAETDQGLLISEAAVDKT